mgnify:FL=1
MKNNQSRKSNVHPSAASRRNQKKRYDGNYLGIVVQNNDPEQRGRVKVYIPHINAQIYDNWDNLQYKKDGAGIRFKDKKFKSIGRNVAPEMANVIDDVKVKLPWAECAAPLMGESASGRYNAHSSVSTISDSARLDTIMPVEKDTDQYTDVNTKYKLNDEGLGESPGYRYEVATPPVDGFTSALSGCGSPVNVNKFSSQYKPSTYSNKSKGVFSVPNVGTHVWVWHEDGNPMKPVYFAVSHGREDWQGIHECSKDDAHGIDMPGAYENKSKKDDPSYNHNTETYRNKFVFNQKGGAIEICSTDNRELLKMTHYSGSFKEFNNHTTTEFAANNDQKLVNDDMFLTVNGSRNELVGEEYDLIIRGDHYRKVGTFNIDKFLEWKALVQDFANIKQLFEVKRCNYTETEIGDFQFQSPAEIQDPPGNFAECPLCTHPDRTVKMWDTDNAGLTALAMPTINSSNSSVYVSYVSPNGDVAKEDWWRFIVPDGNEDKFLQFGVCPLCQGTGKSPSSMGGTWTNRDKDNLIWEKSKLLSDALVPIERELGLGGSEILHVTKHKIETIGLLMNDFPCLRIDPAGKLENSHIIIRPGGVITAPSVVPLIEEVHVDDLPGGSYTLNVCNRYNVQVGAGGVSMKTIGNVEIGGAMMTIAGEQVNVVSENEININSKRVSIVADILSLRQKNYEQVLVDSSLGVSNNLIVGGGAHIEGELTVNHITAPEEIQETEQTDLYAYLLSGLSFTATLNGFADSAGHAINGTTGTVTLNANSNDDKVQCYNHSHQFKNVPLHLMKTSDDVRTIGMNCTTTNTISASREKISAHPVEHKNKGGGLTHLGETI